MNTILLEAVDWFFQLLNFLIIARVILSWLPISPNNPFSALVYQLTEPILGPIRYLLEKSVFGGRGMMLDFSSIIAMFLLQALRSLVLIIITSFLL